MPELTIIIPLKDWEDERLLLLLNSIMYLKKHHEVELIVVYSLSSPQSLFSKYNISTENVKFISSEPRGIYNAFNVGVNNATGRWTMFFGGDDLVLPSLSELLSKLKLSTNMYDAVVCPVAFGDQGIFNPFKSKYGLVFRNWCQQGVLYSTKIFLSLSFDESYPIQADHKFNIELAAKSRNKILYDGTVVSYFNTGGISQKIHDTSFRREMPLIIESNFGSFWKWMSIARRMLGTFRRRYL